MKKLVEILLFSVLSFTSISIIWPPITRYNIWGDISELIGDSLTLFIATTVLLLISGIIGYLIDVEWSNLAIGSVISYVLLMIIIHLEISPDSPVHLILYSGLFLLWSISVIVTNRFM